jgi:hypothetical protein
MSENQSSLTCTFHPKRETQLRCNRCDRPICIKCATHTPTGYRCPECIRSQQKVFVTTRWYDQIIAAVITIVISYFSSLLTTFLTLGIYNFLIPIVAGYLAVWTVKKAIQNRRSPLLKYVMSGTALFASLAPSIFSMVQNYRMFGVFLVGGIQFMLWKLGYAVLIAVFIYYQLKN